MTENGDVKPASGLAELPVVTGEDGQSLVPLLAVEKYVSGIQARVKSVEDLLTSKTAEVRRLREAVETLTEKLTKSVAKKQEKDKDDKEKTAVRKPKASPGPVKKADEKVPAEGLGSGAGTGDKPLSARQIAAQKAEATLNVKKQFESRGIKLSAAELQKEVEKAEKEKASEVAPGKPRAENAAAAPSNCGDTSQSQPAKPAKEKDARPKTAPASSDSGARKPSYQRSKADTETKDRGQSLLEEAIKYQPCKSMVFAPSGWSAGDDSLDNTMRLSHVVGYNGHDGRCNAMYTGKDESVIVYPAGNTVVILEGGAGSIQKHFRHHEDTVTALSVHSNGVLVASGQGGKKPCVVIWNHSTLAVSCTIPLQTAPALLAFSPDGNWLTVVGTDKDRTLVTYDWANPKENLREGGSVQVNKDGPVLGCQYVPGLNDTIAVCGVKFFKVLSNIGPKEQAISTRRGVFGQQGSTQALVSCAHSGKYCFTGTASGDIYSWNGNELSSVLEKHHTGAVTGLWSDAEGLISGGKEGKLCFWDADSFSFVKELELSSDDSIGAVRSICRSNGKILIGTGDNKLYEVAEEGGSPQLITGAHAGDLRGLATSDGKVLTVGSEKEVLLVDSKSRSVIASTKTLEEPRCCTISGDATRIAVGQANGTIAILDGGDLSLVGSVSTKGVPSLVRFSPDAAILAVAHGLLIELFNVSSLKRHCLFNGHLKEVKAFDWGLDGKTLQSNCAGFQIIYWDVEKKEQIRHAKSARDTEWATWTCPLGWPVQGLFNMEKVADINEITDVARGKNEDDTQILAVGESSGKIRLHAWPCLKKSVKSNSKRIKAHAGPVRGLQWLPNGAVSVGETDGTVLYWSLQRKDE